MTFRGPSRGATRSRVKKRPSSQLIHRRVTLCLHVCNKHSENFIVKDCWTHQGRKVTEEQILQKLKEHGIHGLPILREAWTVQIDGQDDTTDLCCPAFLMSSGNCRAMCEPQVHRHYLLQPLGEPIIERWWSAQGLACRKEGSVGNLSSLASYYYISIYL